MLGREGQKKRRQRKLHFNRLTDRPIDASRFRATGLDWANRNHRLSPRAISAPASLRSLVLSHQIKRLLQSAGLRSSFDPHRRFSITRLRHTSQMPCPLSDALPTPNAVPPLVLMHVWHCWYTWVFHNGWNTPVPAPMQAPKNMHLPGLGWGAGQPRAFVPCWLEVLQPPPKERASKEAQILWAAPLVKTVRPCMRQNRPAATTPCSPLPLPLLPEPPPAPLAPPPLAAPQMLRYAAKWNLRVAGRDVWPDGPEEGAEGWRAKRNIRVRANFSRNASRDAVSI